MAPALSGLLILLYLAPGFLVAKFFGSLKNRLGSYDRIRSVAEKIQEKVLSLSLYFLLFLMGLRLFSDPQVSDSLPVLGLQALGFAFLSVAFSVLAALPFRFRRKTADNSDQKTAPTAEQKSPANANPRRASSSVWKIAGLFLSPAKLLAVVLLGALAAIFVPQTAGLPLGLLSDLSLKVMLVAVGIGLGFTRGANIRESFGREALLLPFVTAMATLASGFLAGLLFLPSSTHALAVAGGFGWYSLSAVLLSDLGYTTLGALAFLSNLFRESLALLSIPFLLKAGKTTSAIAAAGATSMDVALPVLTLYGAGPALPASIYHGFVLSLLVPVAVPLFMAL